MSILKLKAALAVTIIGVVGLSSPAFAQVTTDDRDAQGLLEQIRDINREIRDTNDEIKTLQENARDFRNDETKPHYEREVKRLNSMIESLGYWKSADNSDPTKEDNPSEVAFDDLETSIDARTAVQTAGDGTDSNKVGIVFTAYSGADGNLGGGIGAGGTAPNPDQFREALGLHKPEVLYPGDNNVLASNLARQYSSVYLANSVAGESHKGREARLEVYTNLLTRAKAAGNLREELRVQNAILLENGRNLALLIDLQTAQLNAQTVEMTNATIESQLPREMFGGNDSGLQGALEGGEKSTVRANSRND